jgi:hypothetical protein
VGNQELKRDVLEPLEHIREEELPNILKQSNYQNSNNYKEIIENILEGKLALFTRKDVYLVNVANPPGRQVKTIGNGISYYRTP